MSVALYFTMIAILKVRTNLSNLFKILFSERNLLYTNVGISFISSGVGDVISQKYEVSQGKIEEFNAIRTRNMSASGLSIGLICHYWYQWLDKRLPGYTIRTVINKIVVDQLVCSPLCISTLFLTTGYLEGTTGTQLLKEVKEKGLKLYFAEWIVWPTAQFVNFYLLPTKYRVLYDNAVSLGYDIYTSAVKNDQLDSEMLDKER